MEPRWIRLEFALIAHDEQLAEHGGLEGIRDMAGLESALARAQNLLAYSKKTPTIAQLAAAYAVGISKNHPFVDGNKRTALVVCFTFLKQNGFRVTASPPDRYETFDRLASGSLPERQLAEWLEKFTEPIKKAPHSTP